MPKSAIVIGSGSAAAGTVHALLSQGWQITVLDIGNRLEPDIDQVVNRMAKLPVEKWDPADLAVVTKRSSPGVEANQSKRVFGSDYPFNDRDNLLNIHWNDGICFNHSLAYGGLSNIWGSSMLPYRDEDMTAWPINSSEMAPHYQAIMELVPCTGESGDDIDTILPRYSQQSNSIRLSQQGEGMLQHLLTNRTNLLRSGIRAGKARLAIKAVDSGGQNSCQYCGLCLSGCPYGLIYSSAHSFSTWIRNAAITYHPKHKVDRVEQTPDGALVHGQDLTQQEAFRMHADRVFIAAGVLPTAQIVLNSRPELDTPLRLIDSQYFIYPILRLKPAGDVGSERMHTSCQIFMEVDDPKISQHLVHLQIYGYSSFLHQEILRTFIRFPLRSKRLQKWFFSRLMIIQGFIHSDESGHIELSATRNKDGGVGLLARPIRSLASLRVVLMLGLKLLRHTRSLGVLVLIPGLKIPRPGVGYHSGGTFPMKSEPGHGETDTIGRLNGWKSIHIVDSSVFPSVPATTITMSAMANAHRIATLASQSEVPVLAGKAAISPAQTAGL